MNIPIPMLRLVIQRMMVILRRGSCCDAPPVVVTMGFLLHRLCGPAGTMSMIGMLMMAIPGVVTVRIFHRVLPLVWSRRRRGRGQERNFSRIFLSHGRCVVLVVGSGGISKSIVPTMVVVIMIVRITCWMSPDGFECDGRNITDTTVILIIRTDQSLRRTILMVVVVVFVVRDMDGCTSRIVVWIIERLVTFLTDFRVFVILFFP
jgi:hypothetical protein